MRLSSLLIVLGAVATIGLTVGDLGANESDTEVFFEQEPNDVSPHVLDMRPGAQPGEPVQFRIKGRIETADDVDRFEMDLNVGDVVGVAIRDTSGVNPALRLENEAGDLVIANEQSRRADDVLPADSPFPKANGYGNSADDAVLYVVIVDEGTYVVEARGEDGTDGRSTSWSRDRRSRPTRRARARSSSSTSTGRRWT